MDFKLINSEGTELSNGVYFFKLEVKQNSRVFRRKGKFVIYVDIEYRRASI